MTTAGSSLSEAGPAPEPGRRAAPAIGAWLPTWDLITTKNLEIRKRRGLIITVAMLIVAPTVLICGLRLLSHAVDPHGYGLAGSPALFSQLTNLMAEFGFIAAAALGATAGTTDLSDGMFCHLVITGRSRLALYLARIPAGLAITVPLVALAFAMNCLVTSYESPPPPTSVSLAGVNVPEHLDQAGLQTWLLQHPQQVASGFIVDGPSALGPPRRRSARRSTKTSRPSTAPTQPTRSPARTRRPTRWPRSGYGLSLRPGSDSWSASASDRSPGSGRPRPSC